MASAPAAAGLQRTPSHLQLGEQVFPIRGATLTGEPVIHMWSAPLFQEGQPNGGLRVVSAAEHHVVWKPTVRSEGAFNHHSALGAHWDHLFAMWSNHPLGEDASGQRILFSLSSDGRTWRKPQELFPAPDDIRASSESGLVFKPDRWWSIGARWFAVAYLSARNLPGFGEHAIAREVGKDGSLGPLFFLLAPPTRPMRFDIAAGYDPQVAGMAAALLGRYTETGTVSWWAQREGLPDHGIDGVNLIEPFTYHTAAGVRMLLMRAYGRRYNNRMYVSVASTDGWSIPRPTDIPDSPSRTTAVSLRSGVVLLVGNQIAPYFDRGVYWDRDPLTVAISPGGNIFDRVFILRTGAPREWRFPGITARNLGFAYPSAVVRGNTLFVLYSVGKEDIAITEVPLSSLGL